MNELQYEKLIHSCTENCPMEYCFIKMFLIKQHPSERVILQLKCIEIAKWTWSAEAGKDIGWNETGQRWVTGGYAKAFSDVYNEDESVLINFKKTIEAVKKSDCGGINS